MPWLVFMHTPVGHRVGFAVMEKVISPEMFGAKADGIHNDAPAFWAALAEAAKQGGTLLLQKNAVYYLAKSKHEADDAVVTSGAILNADGADKAAAIVLDGAHDLTIKGENTTILIEAPLFFCNINHTKNVTLEGLNFNYRIKPFVGARTLALDIENGTAEVETDRPLYIDGDCSQKGHFGVLDLPYGRWHMFLKGYEVIDKNANRYRVLFSDDGATRSRMERLMDTRLILPVPGIGHAIERGFSIVGNTDFTMRNCNIWSTARFMFALFRNEGTMLFENVHITPEPGEDLPIVGWRDGYHVKENRAKFIWKNCSAEGLFDDIFNISASMLNVQQVYADDDIDLLWGETHGVYAPLRSGDRLTVFDVSSGELIGSTSVKEVILQEGSHNRIRLEKPLPGVKAGPDIRVCFDSMVAPGSEITGCDFNGTLRFRGPVEIQNCRIHVLRMWIDLETTVEGPIPAGVHFTDCTLECDDDHEIYFHLLSQRKNNSGKKQYHLNDIRFQNCRLCRENFEIGPEDTPYVAFV